MFCLLKQQQLLKQPRDHQLAMAVACSTRQATDFSDAGLLGVTITNK
ncbi:hypothetical protein ACP70R_000320 [Stipagrostis hirtigluma subsp. patula]